MTRSGTAKEWSNAFGIPGADSRGIFEFPPGGRFGCNHYQHHADSFLVFHRQG
jgi:hypothetical protein